MDKQKTLKNVEKSYQSFLKSYTGLTADQLQLPGVTGEWSVRDILAHVADWENEMLRRIPILLGESADALYPAEYTDADDFNAQMTARHTGWDLQEVLFYQSKAHKALMERLEQVPDPWYDGRRRFTKHLRGNTTDHYTEHATAIREWRKTADLSHPRALNWEGLSNARDLGGVRSRNGKVTTSKRIVRADSPSRLSDEGIRQLIDYGVSLISAQELEWEPSPFAMGELGVKYLHIPFISDDPAYLPTVEAVDDIRGAYRVMLDYCPTAIANVLRAIAAHGGTSLYHCASGKDRTGLISLFLLKLADAPDDAIAADFAVSKENLWPVWLKMVADAGGLDNIHPWFEPVTDAADMLATIEYINSKYGSVEQYLAGGGLTDEEMNRLRQILL